MNLGLQDRVAVITGGSSGIGLATARTLLEEGARVAVCARRPDRLEAARAELERLAPGRVFAQSCDVVDKAAVERFASAVMAWSGDAVDALVNNAGQGRVSTFEQTTDADWRDELELKFFSQIHPLQAFLPGLRRSDGAAVVAVNSLLALQPEPHMVCTSAARAGAQSLVKSLAREFAPGIRVNSVLLGLIDSGQWSRRFESRENESRSRSQWLADLAREKGIPLERLGAPEEAARAIVFLVSPAASYVTGASLEISGGVSRHI